MLWASLLVVGFFVGLVGGGGGLLASPLLVYLGAWPLRDALLGALAVSAGGGLGAAGLGFGRGVGANRYQKAGLMGGGALGAALAVPLARHLPELLLQLALSFTLLLGGYTSWTSRPRADEAEPEGLRRWGFLGLAAGLLTGLVGGGAGLVVAPGLVRFAHLSWRQAVAASGLVLATNASVSLGLHRLSSPHPALTSLLLLALLAGLGAALGHAVQHRMPLNVLRKGLALMLGSAGLWGLVALTLQDRKSVV